MLLPCLGWPGRRPLKLVWTHIGLLRQMNGLCLTHTIYSTSRPRQMKLRWPDPPPSFGPSLRLLGLHLNPRPAALFTYFDTNYSRHSLALLSSPQPHFVSRSWLRQARVPSAAVAVSPPAGNYNRGRGVASGGGSPVLRGHSAMAVVVTVEDIRRSGSGTQRWALNNTALKSLRDSNEQPPGFPTGDGRVDLTNLDPCEVLTLHRTKGMEYELLQPMQPWSWRRMLAGCNNDTLERIVGPGVRRVLCMAIPKSYDHKRHHAARLANRQYRSDAPVPVWDFVVERTDGTRVRFHPNQTNRKIAVADYAFEFERNGPAAGRGRSDGPGTYRAMLWRTYNEAGAGQPTAEEQHENRERARLARAKGIACGRHTRGGSAHTRGGGGGCCHGSAPAAAQCCDSAAAWARPSHCHVLFSAAACGPAASGG